MAAEEYDFDDGLIRRSPPLERQIVNLRPSPSPDYLPPPERSPSPECQSRLSNSKKKRRPKAQASQGDAVLIGFMGGLNHPELATRAGEEPLPQSDDSDIEEQMDVDGIATTNANNSKLVQLAENALPLLDGNRESGESQSGSPRAGNVRPSRPKILTQRQASDSKDDTHLFSNGQCSVENTGSNSVVDGFNADEDGNQSSLSRPRSTSSGKEESDSVAISPMLRKFTIPTAQRSPTETLPAMHGSASLISTRAPNGQQNLPSLRALGVEPLLDGRSPNEAATHGPNRPPLHVGNSVLNSPSVNSIPPKPGQFSTPQTRMSAQFSSPYSHGQLSPAYSDPSPRERDPANMSPPVGKPISQAFVSNGRTPQSEDLTPQSAESHGSSSSFSTAPSPHGQQTEFERGRPTLPPLPGLPSGPLITGSFRCDYAGCTAPPFQTQYLLK